MQKYHILIVDDDREIRELIERFLHKEGFSVTTARDAAEARQLRLAIDFDLLIVDVMMPGESGLSLTRDFRKSSSVPILMLTAQGEMDDRINGLEAGADDYLPKPFEPRELLLRIKSILRRSHVSNLDEEELKIIQMGECQFNITREELSRDEKAIKLTSAEAAILKTLALANEPLSREAIIERSAIEGDSRAVDVHVTRLRRKIEVDPKIPRHIITIRGHGYALKPSNIITIN